MAKLLLYFVVKTVKWIIHKTMYQNFFEEKNLSSTGVPAFRTKHACRCCIPEYMLMAIDSYKLHW